MTSGWVVVAVFVGLLPPTAAPCTYRALELVISRVIEGLGFLTVGHKLRKHLIQHPTFWLILGTITIQSNEAIPQTLSFSYGPTAYFPSEGSCYYVLLPVPF